jgi:hypothetical protein
MKKGYVARKGGSCPLKVGSKAAGRAKTARRVGKSYHAGSGGYASGFERWKAEQAAASASMPMLNGFGRARGRRRFGRRFF